MNRFVFFYIFLFSVLISCSNLNENYYKYRCVGRELNIDSLTFSSLTDNGEKVERYKIVSYIDSLHCFGCMLRLDQRKSFLIELESIKNSNIDYVLVLNTKNREAIDRLKKIYKFDYKIILDSLNTFSMVNSFIPKSAFYKTFLLDSNNIIECIGSPIFIEKYREYYINKFLRN